jgi:uncharacterized membrane protein
MKIISCRTMREGVLVSGAFLVAGLVLLLVASSGLLPEAAYLPLIFDVAGAFCLLFAPVLLLGTFVTTVLPKSRDKLDECDH